MEWEEIKKILDECRNPVIGKAILTVATKMRDYEKVLVSVSGGADSDVVVDMLCRFGDKNKIDFVYFDTGLEYQATKDQIKFLEEKYGITIQVLRPKIPIPLSCKKYGQPFVSKRVSEMIGRLQRAGFKWEDEPMDILLKKYPNCRSGIRWWCNDFGEKSMFNINRNKKLKEFMIANPPTFLIDNKCCDHAKKSLAHDKLKERYDLNVTGVRKAEGGVRSFVYTSCFDTNGDTYDNFRPIFWFSDADKKEYEDMFGITHSKCYTEYGLKRTGCCGCPFSRKFEFELEVIENHEPKFYNAVNNVFKDSYEYTRAYKEFKNRKE